MPDSLLDANFWLTALAILGLLSLSAFFSGSETVTATSRGILRSHADKGSRGAKTALEVTDDGEQMIGALRLGNNVVNILSASLTAALLTRIFGTAGAAITKLVIRCWCSSSEKCSQSRSRSRCPRRWPGEWLP